MQIKILLFGILRDLIGENIIYLRFSSGDTLEDLKQNLRDKYPQLNDYQNYSVAVNEAYTEGDCTLEENDIIALIPPVSGG